VKRDMELARSLLLQITDEDIRKDEWDQTAIYHLKMLTDVGYLEGINFFTTNSNQIHFALLNPQLTWAGHEFFDTIRSKTVWEKIKKVLKDKGLDLSVETIKLAAPSVLASILK
jgi:Hypothetical protein (DUF2513)